jgi:processive 1,2-diacylglycerol beta-glucosyltransferase
VLRRALILSGSLGEGHQASAARLDEVLTSLGWSVRTLDAMDLLGRRAGRAGERTFRVMIAAGGLYDAFHFAHLRSGSRLAGGLDRLAAGRLVPAVRRELAREPADLLVSTFPTGASAAARLARAGAPVRTVVVCTDPVVHRLWVQEGTDLFLVTSWTALASVRRFLPAADVRVIGMPLRPEFHRPPAKQAARTELGLPAEAPVVMVLGGGWGLGPIATVSAALARRGVHVLAVAGRNERVYRRLRRLADTHPQIHPFGFTDRIAALISAADVVVSAPGAASCAEVRAVGRPLVLLDVLPGHGRESVDHQLGRGGALVAGPGAASVTGVVLAALADPPPLAAAEKGDWAGEVERALRDAGILGAGR